MYLEEICTRNEFLNNQLVKDITNNGWQSFETPSIICKELINKYQFNQDDKILVLFNVELVKELYISYSDEIILNNIYFVADTIDKFNYIKIYLPMINCKYLEENKWTLEDLNNIIKEFNMPKHFDVTFTNPPYNDSIDLKMIKNLIDNNISKQIICVHPGIFLINHNNDKLSDELRNTNTLKEVTFFWGNDIFNTGVENIHCISIWNKEHKSNIVKIIDKAFTERKEVYNEDTFTYEINVNDITVHSKIAERAAEIYHKFINCDSILNHITNINSPNKTQYGFKSATMRGGLGYLKRNYGMFFSLFGNGAKAMNNAKVDKNVKFTDYLMSSSTYRDTYPMWYFNSEEERTNFINYFKLKCVRFLLSLIKCNPNLNAGKPTRIIPWMDFSKHWSEKELIKLWGFEDIWEYIDKFIPDYYEDYREICK